MGKFKKFTHTLVVHTLVVSLTIWSLPPKVEANEALSENNIGGAIIGATKMIGQQMMNVKMQNAALMQQAAIQQQLQPKLVPARFFPQCQVPQSFNAPPEGVCEQVQNPMQLGAIQGYQQLAFKYDDLYTRMSSPAQNTPFPQGLQCIEESAKRTDADMQDKLNALTAFQNKIRKEMQLFRDQNKKLLDEMEGVNQELNGGQNGSLEAKKSDLASSFSTDCQNIMGGPAALNQLAKGKGLLGLQAKMDSSVRGAANDFINNQAVYKKDIDQLVNKMVKKMNSDGIDNFDLTAKDIRGLNADMVKRVSETFQGEVAALQKYREQISSDIKKTGIDFDMPRFDKNFKVDFEEFRAGAKVFYQKKYVHECVTGSGSTSLGLSAGEILNGLQQRSIRGASSGNAVTKYREALQNILDQDNMIEDKLAQIKALDAQYSGRGEVTITYQDGQAKTKTATPYELYMETVKNCQEQFTQDNTFSTSAQGVSMKKKVERVQSYLDQLKKKHDAFVADAASSISDSLMNCNGAKLKDGPGMCSGDMMSPKSASFCMAHAQQCSGQVNKCYSDLKGKVEQKSALLKSKAQLYNANVGTLVARQEAILKEVQNQVMATSEGIKRFFPGANYTFPKDLFVAMPPMMGANDPGNKFGIDLIGGGDLKSLEALPQKIELLKAQLTEQKGKIQNVISKYASEQGNAIKQNQSKWKAFSAKCKATEKAFRQQVAAADAKKQQDAAKAKQDVKNFCDKYKRLKNLSPAAGCGKVEDLYEESNKIAAHVTGDVKGSLDAYTNVCEGRKNGDEDEDEDKTPKIQKMCERKTWDEIKSQTLSNLLEKLPADIAKHKEAIKAHVLAGDTDTPLSSIAKEVANSDYADYIANATKLHGLKPEGQSSSTQIKELAQNMRDVVEGNADAKSNFGALINIFSRSSTKDDAKTNIDNILAKAGHSSSPSDNPFSDLIKQAEVAITKVEAMPEGDLNRAPASNSENTDLCKNIDEEVRNVAASICSDKTEGKNECLSKHEKELKVNEENGVDSRLSVTSRANTLLTNLDKGRGIASAQDWSKIGENASDSCEATAANGRNFMGIDLGEFDMATGAMPLGNTGAMQ